MIPAWLPPVAAGSALALLAAAEHLFPLRPRVSSVGRRLGRNLATGALGAAVVVPLQLAALAPWARFVGQREWGLLHALALPGWAAAVAAFLLLDWTLWGWHLVNHRVPLLWRFHLVHHLDRDLDASTALRFHFGELGLSIGYRALQLAAIGATLTDLAHFHLVLLVATLFHHSNLRLPHALERRLVHLVVTPRMHGIHHSTVRQETDSNFSSILTVWDHLHRTIRLHVPQREVTVGVPAYREERSVTFGRIQLLPFRRGLVTWAEPGTAPPDRDDPPGSRAALAE